MASAWDCLQTDGLDLDTLTLPAVAAASVAKEGTAWDITEARQVHRAPAVEHITEVWAVTGATDT